MFGVAGLAGRKDIRVLIADDSRLIRQLVRRSLEKYDRIQVVGEAADGSEILPKIEALNPHVLVLDVEMPRMDGISALKSIMALRPLPVVMFSSLTARGTQTTLEALAAGAVDFLPKPASRDGWEKISHELCQKVIAASSARVRVSPAERGKKDVTARQFRYPARGEPARWLAVVGSSTGGPQALEEIILSLPSELSGCVVVCQHMPGGFTSSLARRLDSRSRIPVKEACEGDQLLAGTVLIAPGGYHLRIAPDQGGFRVRLDKSQPVHGVRPSVDITLEDAASLFRQRLLVVILTGMGFDGARGALRAKAVGATVVCQDEETSVVWGMPRACIELGACSKVLPVHEIASEICRFAEYAKALADDLVLSGVLKA